MARSLTSEDIADCVAWVGTRPLHVNIDWMKVRPRAHPGNTRSSVSDGLQQAIRYAQQLDVALAYATNGSVIIGRDMVTGHECYVDSVRTPPELWSRYCEVHSLDAEQAAALQQPFNRNRRDASGAVVLPRFYQTVAVHRALRAMTSGQWRILLLMATGTGKTFTAMQIVAKWLGYQRLRSPESNFRVLYLAEWTSS